MWTLPFFDGDRGQTPDQVRAAPGKPDKIVDLGRQQIYA
jgi:hypothetical protein